MKAFRGTAVLSILVIALAAYTAWEYKKAALESGNAPHEKSLFTFVPEQVEQVKLTGSGETILVARENGEWKMKQPVEDQAESSAMDALIYSVGVQKGKVFRGEEESAGTKWAEFGLEPPGALIEITANKKTESLAVSSKNAFDGSYYLRQGGELMLGDHGIAQIVARDAGALRTHHLWRERDATVEAAQVEIDWDNLKDKFSLKKDGGKWTLEPKPGFAIDEGRLDQWVTAVQGLMPSEIAGETLSEGEKRNYLLLKPSLIVHFQYKKADGTKGEWAVTAGQDRAEDVFLYTTIRPTVYKTPHSSLSLVRVSRDYFRDGKRPFKFAVEQAHDVSVSSGGFNHTFTKDGSTWKLAGIDKNLEIELDSEKLVTLIHNLTSLEAQEFPPAKDAKGFKPTQRIVVRDSQGQTLFDVSWGDEYKAKQSWNKGMTFRFVKTNLEKEAMGVNAGRIASLIEKSLVTPKAESKLEKK